MASDDTVSVKIAADVSELRAKLQEAKLSIAEFKGQIAELAATQNASAADYQKSIQLTDQLKATQQQATIITGQLATATKQLGSDMDSTTSSGINLESMLTRIAVRSVLMYAAVRPVMSAIQEIIKEHEAWSAAAAATDFTLGKESETVKQFAKDLAGLGSASGGQILAGFNEINNRAHDVAASLNLTSLALDLSVASGAKFETAAKAIASAVQGQSQGIQDLGIKLDEHEKKLLKAATAGEKLAIVEGLIAEKASGAADALYRQYAIPTTGGNTPQELANYQMQLAAEEQRHFALEAKGAGEAAVGARLDMLAEADAAVRGAQAIEKTAESHAKLASIESQTANAIASVTKLFDRPPDDAFASGLQNIADRAEQVRRSLTELATSDQIQAALDRAKAGVEAAQAALDIAKSKQANIDAEQIKVLQASAAEHQAAASALLQEAAALDAASGKIQAQIPLIQAKTEAEKRAYSTNYMKLASEEAEKALAALEAREQEVASRFDDLFNQSQTKLSGLAPNFAGPGSDYVAALKQEFADLYAQRNELDEAEFKERARLIQEELKLMLEGMIANAHAFGEEFARQMQQATRDLAHDFQSIFEGITTGNLDSALKGISREAGKDFGKYAANALLGLLGLQGPQQNDPSTWMGQGSFAEAQKAYQGSALQQKNATEAATIVAGAQAALGLYQIATTQGISVGQGALQGAALGLSVGAAAGPYAVIGAVIGAVVGGLAAAFAPAASTDYKYGDFAYTYGAGGPGTPGGAFLRKDVLNQNLSQGEIDQTLEQINATVQNFNDRYVAIFAKLGPQFMAQLDALLQHEDFSSGLPGVGGAFVGSAPSKNFLKHLNDWLTIGLPGQLNDYFWNPLASALGSTLGLSQAKLDELHTEMNALNPKDAIALVEKLVDTILAINKTMAQLSGTGPNGNLVAAAYANAHTPSIFSTDTKNAIADLQNLANSIKDLSDPSAIDTLSQINQGMQNFYQMALQYVSELEAAQTSIDQSLNALIEKHKLNLMTKADGSPDYQSQVNYLYTQEQFAIGQEKKATTAADIQYWAGQAASYLEAINGIAAKIGGSTAKQFEQWTLQQEQALEKTTNDRIAALEKMAQDAASALAATFKPYVDAFLAGSNAVDNLSTAIGGGNGGDGGGGGHGGAVGAIDELGSSAVALTAAFNTLAKAIVGSAGGAGTTGAGGGSAPHVVVQIVAPSGFGARVTTGRLTNAA